MGQDKTHYQNVLIHKRNPRGAGVKQRNNNKKEAFGIAFFPYHLTRNLKEQWSQHSVFYIFVAVPELKFPLFSILNVYQLHI